MQSVLPAGSMKQGTPSRGKSRAYFLALLFVAASLLAAIPTTTNASSAGGKFRAYHWTGKGSGTHAFKPGAAFHLQVHLVGCSKHPRFTMFRRKNLVYLSIKYGRHDFTSPKYPAGSYRLRIVVYKGRCTWSVWVRKGA